MTILVQWDDAEKTIIRYAPGDGWMWGEFYTALDQIHAMQGQVNYPVDVITDLRGGTFLADGFVAQVKRVADAGRPLDGIHVIVGSNPFWRSLFVIVTRIYSDLTLGYYFASSLEEAYAIIASHRTQRKRA